MIVTLLAAALAAPYVTGTDAHPVHLRLDTAASWGIGGQMFLGGQVHLAAQTPVWTGKTASATADAGLQLAYHNEATFLAPWVDRDTTTGAGHRVHAVAVAGVTFHAGPQRRVAVGLQWFAGLNVWRSDYAVAIPEADIDAHEVVQRLLPVTGGQVTIAARLSERVGIDLFMQAPIPTSSSYAVGLAALGIGPVFYLR
ncbi:MAG TPA: hypothetical protein PKA64_02060 [Myxococcota bacterium]|nr:hypothetical protein [Myxococcota bacterium]